ncbi:MAG TPA: hypothetical protein VGD65_14505 [Chryseosolibacter sp.]
MKGKIHYAHRPKVTSSFETSAALDLDLSSITSQYVVSLFLNKSETKVYIMTTTKEVYVSSRSTKKSVFSPLQTF